ncbi:MAG: V-type ATP synthase subunit E family protein [Candidatus Micrarchaeota archaeon]
MGIDDLKKEIVEDADSQAKKMLEEARAQARQITADAKQNAKKIVSDGKEKSLKEAVEKNIEISSARLQGRKLMSEAKDAVVRKVFEDLRIELAAFAKSKEYPAVLAKLAKQAVAELGEEAVLHVRKQDAALLKGAGKVSSDYLDCIGGLIAETPDKRIRVDCTFEALIESHEDEIRQKCFEEFFPVRKKAAAEKITGKKK